MLTVTDEEGLTDTANVTIAVSTAGGGGGCAPVTAPWTSSDIGSVGAAGSACEESGRFEVDASGADIWNSSDEFHYVYQSLSGDGEIIARVVSLDNTNQWAKAGVMMRNTLDANSAFVLMSMSPNPNGQGPSYTLQQRNTAGEAMAGGNNIGPVAAGFPYYVRLVRQGNTFSGYASATNGNWSLLGSRTVAMGSTIYVGLAVTSHNDGVITQAVFEDVNVISSSLPSREATDTSSQNLDVLIETNQGTEQAFALYPNPTTGEVNLNMTNFMGESLEVIVINSLSQIVYKANYNDKHTKNEILNLDSLSEGMYYIIISASGKKVVEPLIIKK